MEHVYKFDMPIRSLRNLVNLLTTLKLIKKNMFNTQSVGISNTITDLLVVTLDNVDTHVVG